MYSLSFFPTRVTCFKVSIIFGICSHVKSVVWIPVLFSRALIKLRWQWQEWKILTKTWDRRSVIEIFFLSIWKLKTKTLRKKDPSYHCKILTVAIEMLVWVKKLHLSVVSSSGSREYIKASIPFVSTTFVYNGQDRISGIEAVTVRLVHWSVWSIILTTTQFMLWCPLDTCYWQYRLISKSWGHP